MVRAPKFLLLALVAVAGFVVVLGLGASGLGHAQDAPAVTEGGGRTLFLQLEPARASLLDRVRGQISDLDVDLRVEDGAALRGRTLAEQVSLARTRATALDAAVVLWAERVSADLLNVYVYQPALGRLLVREIPSTGSSRDSTASEEAAAVVARASLRAIELGGEIGVALPDLGISAEPPAAAPPSAAAPSAPRGPAPPPAPPPQRDDETDLAIAMGWRATIDGLSSAGRQGVRTGALFDLDHLDLGLLVGLGLPTTIDDPLFEAQVSVYDASVRARVPLVESRRWVFRAGVGVGAAAFVRAPVLVRSSQLSPSGGRTTFSFALDAEVELAFVALLHRLQIVLGLGASWLPGAPELGFVEGGAFVARRTPWAVQPSLALGVEILL